MKEIVLGLVAIGTAPYSASKIEDVFAKEPVPIEQKINALEVADDILKSSNFHRAVEEYIQRLQTETEKGDPDQKDTKINTVQDIPPDKSDSQIKAIASTLIKPVEIYGTDINDPRNKGFLRPYKDDIGIYTIGIGHKIGDGSKAAKNKWVKKYGHSKSPKFAEKLFDKQLDYHLNRVKAIFGGAFDSFTNGQAGVLVDISYRGDLLPDMDWVKLLKTGKNKEGASEYLNHKEYKKRKKEGRDGVVKRMERNAGILTGDNK